MSEHQNLLKEIQICDFALLEATLYLDTHKTDSQALEFYQKHKKMNVELREEYNKKYGPLTINDCNSTTTWGWVNSSWPWEYSYNERGAK